MSAPVHPLGAPEQTWRREALVDGAIHVADVDGWRLTVSNRTIGGAETRTWRCFRPDGYMAGSGDAGSLYDGELKAERWRLELLASYERAAAREARRAAR